MTPNQKSILIRDIISTLKFTASQGKKQFDEGDTFLSLCFKTDNELLKIAKFTGVNDHE